MTYHTALQLWHIIKIVRFIRPWFAVGENTYTDGEFEQWKVACGLETTQLASVGVYHYRSTDNTHQLGTCSVIVQAGSRVRHHDCISIAVIQN